MSYRGDYLTNAKRAVEQLRKMRNGNHAIDDVTSKLTPLAALTKAQREKFREDFLLWWDSWVAPAIDTLDRKVNPPKKAKTAAVAK